MAIQFQCPACRQPIEIDDEFGGSAVGCPYCRTTVTAPRESTLGPSAAPGSAKPVPPGSFASFPPTTFAPAASLPTQGSASRNVVALVAFALSLVTAFFLLVTEITAARHADELTRISKEFVDISQQMQSKSQSEMQNRMNELASSLPGWFMMILGAILAALPCALAALICAIVGVCKQPRRGWAIASLVILFVTFAVACCLPGPQFQSSPVPLQPDPGGEGDTTAAESVLQGSGEANLG